MTFLRNTLALICLTLAAACTPPEPENINGIRIITRAETNAVRTVHVDQINAFRATQGLQPVTLSARLTAAAATHARDMSIQRRAWHFGSDGTSPRDRATRAGFNGTVVGENISESLDDEFAVFQSWLDDPVTRRVMLTPDADTIGIAWFQGENGKFWWVQVLGRSAQAIASLPQSTPAL